MGSLERRLPAATLSGAIDIQHFPKMSKLIDQRGICELGRQHDGEAEAGGHSLEGDEQAQELQSDGRLVGLAAQRRGAAAAEAGGVENHLPLSKRRLVELLRDVAGLCGGAAAAEAGGDEGGAADGGRAPDGGMGHLAAGCTGAAAACPGCIQDHPPLAKRRVVLCFRDLGRQHDGEAETGGHSLEGDEQAQELQSDGRLVGLAAQRRGAAAAEAGGVENHLPLSKRRLVELLRDVAGLCGGAAAAEAGGDEGGAADGGRAPDGGMGHLAAGCTGASLGCPIWKDRLAVEGACCALFFRGLAGIL